MRAVAIDQDAISPGGTIALDELEQHRKALTGYCYRMLGSGFEADDAVQETLVRAWKASESFEGRSAVRSWLYRIAHNVCLDMLRSSQRRARPMEMGPRRSAGDPIGDLLPEGSWITPIPDARVVPEDADPAEIAATRDSIRLAFVAALQHLPASQRAVLILREVLRWQATEVAELLGTSVPSVNSALQRARATLASLDADADGARSPGATTAEQQELLARYVDAFERYDMDSLVTLIHDDARMTMPPFDFWLQGRDEILAFFVGQGISCEGSRLLATTANGSPAFGSYKIDPEGGHSPWAIQVLDVDGDRIVGHHNFIDPALFPAFGLPTHLPE
jgi:RNA polymerase sigma-70 factor, ECF subfamily